MATTIKLKNGSGAPLAGDLVQGEPALDLTNKRLYTENASGTVIEVGTNPTSLTTGTFTSTGIDDNATSTAITIDASENVGIGTASPSTILANVSASATGLAIESAVPAIAVKDTSAADDVGYIYQNANDLNFLNYAGGNTIFTYGSSYTEAVRIDSSGNVNIYGTDARPLAITSFDTVSNGAGWDLDATSSNGVVTMSTGGSERMRIDSSGNTYIGAGSATQYLRFKTGATGTDGGIQWTFNTDSTVFGSLTLPYDTRASVGLHLESAYPATYTVPGNQPHKFVCGGAEAARITSGGLGLGTDSPSTKLDVVGSTTNGSGVVDTIRLRNTGTSLNDGPRIQFTAGASTSGAAIGSQGQSLNSADLLFYAGGNTERMRITSGGRININHQTSGTTGTGSFIVGASSFYIQASQNSSSSTRVPIVFSAIGGTNESMRIDASGNLLIGKTATGESAASGNGFSFNSASVDPFFAIVNSNTTGANAGIYINQRNRTATNYLMYFYSNDGSNNTFVGYISHNGTTTSYISASDARLKENIVDAPAGNIDAIRVRSFDWNTDGSHQTYGLVAQELVDVAPEAVSQGETEDDMWGVDYSKLVPMMIKEIQDLKAEVAALKGA